MTDTSRTSPVSPWASDDLPHRHVRAVGVQVEKVVRFGLPAFVSRACVAGTPGANAELVVEELQIEYGTLWRMSALSFATVQRIAHDQAQSVAGMLAALMRSPLAEANPAGEEPPSPVYWPEAGPVVADGMIRSFGALVAAASEACRELLDIQTVRLLTWVSALRTISRSNGQTDAHRNNEG